MTSVVGFFQIFVYYFREIWFSLLIGFVLSGVLNEFISSRIIHRYLGARGLRSILVSSFIGVLLPVCCFGSLPIALTMQRKGANFGPVLAFLIATPATSVSAILVCWRLLGWTFTLFIFFAAITIGLIIGLLGDRYKDFLMSRKAEDDQVKTGGEEAACCCHDPGLHAGGHTDRRLKAALRYAFITLPKDIGIELIVGIAVASLIMVAQPVQDFIRVYLTGVWGYGFSLVVGLVNYVCSTASVPMVDALMKSGLGPGPGMVYLLVGPITSYGALLVIRKEFGRRVLIFYIIHLCVLSVLFGKMFHLLLRGALI